ncbi:MAG TPA: hypothetical protein VM557_02625 [Thermoanaerobaculia bacterium]|nr:hypothetical protein [Thermoanaerobaculia bacterium]
MLLSGLRKTDADVIRMNFRRFASDASSMDEAGERIVRYLHQELRTESGSALALVRFFKTHPFVQLPPELQRFASNLMSGVERPDWLRCLTLLATAGDLANWQSRDGSRGHQAIPLASEQMVREAPMISQLIQQFGHSIATVVNPPTDLAIEATKTSGVFYVADALGSPHIPAQEEFVRPYGVRSIVGFGGLLPSADLWAVIMFCKVSVSPEVAELFKRLASSLTVSLIPLNARVFK